MRPVVHEDLYQQVSDEVSSSDQLKVRRTRAAGKGGYGTHAGIYGKGGKTFNHCQ
jgi:hypothetical protein